MSFLDDISRVVLNGGGFSPASFSGPGYESVWLQLKPWLGRISTNGVLKWVPRAAAQLPCQVPQYEYGYPVGPCVFHALETCIVCGRPVCLSHAFVDGQQGDAICYLCVAQARSNVTAAPPPQDSRKDHQQAPPKPDPKVEAIQKGWWARGIFNIQEGVPWADVKRQYKILSAQFHPDRAGGDERRFKEVQTAFEILKIIYGES